MRVLVVVHGFPPHAKAGSELYAHHHAAALRAAGDEVMVLTREEDRGRPEYAVRTEARDDFWITWINNTFRLTRSLEESYRNPHIARLAARVIDDFRPDVAHIHHLTCLSTDIVFELSDRRIPSVYMLHDYWLMCHRGQLLDARYERCDGPGTSGCGSCLGDAALPAVVPGALVPLMRRVESRLPRGVGQRVRRVIATRGGARGDAEAGRVRHMRRVCGDIVRFLAPCEGVRQRFIAFGVPAQRIGIWPYGLDPAPFRAARQGPVAKTRGGPLRIGFLGTLMVSKGADVLLEACRQLPEGSYTLDVYGTPADYHGDQRFRTRLEQLLPAPGVTVRGPQPHAEIPRVLGSMDVLVVPSIWPENGPIVVQEAWLSGTPVVASRLGGMIEAVVPGHNGLLFEPGSASALAHALRLLIEDRNLLGVLRAGAAATAVRTLDDDVSAARALHATLVAARSVVAAPPPRLAAVVLNHRTADDTMLAVASLRASRRPPDQIILVDNDDSDECRARAAACGAAVTYLHTGRNLGFSGGMNAGIRAALGAGAERILLVNSDAVLPPKCIGQLEAALEGAGRAVIVGPVLLVRSRPDVVASAGIDYNRRTGRMFNRDHGSRAAAISPANADRQAISGCVMLVAREIFDRIGLLDERYFFGFEDIEFCLRAADAGVGTRLAGRARAYHEGGRAIGPASPRRLYFAARNHLLMSATVGSGDARVVRWGRAWIIAALNIAYAVTAPGGTVTARLAATARGIGDYLRGRVGSDSGR